jgi:hypothetical protein
MIDETLLKCSTNTNDLATSDDDDNDDDDDDEEEEEEADDDDDDNNGDNDDNDDCFNEYTREKVEPIKPTSHFHC